MPLSREQFAENLRRGTEALRANIAQFCWNELPGEDRYFILLNESYDGHPPAPGEHVFPDHDKPQDDRRVPRTPEQVVERLWRDEKVPEWIDITPYETDGEFLYSELRCCGRFTDQQAQLYHVKEGYPPFHKIGPILPVGYRNQELQEKFDLHCYRDRKPKSQP